MPNPCGMRRDDAVGSDAGRWDAGDLARHGTELRVYRSYFSSHFGSPGIWNSCS